jgi:hypothetical protein
VSIEPALVLSILVGVFNASLSILIRGSAGGRLPILLVAAIELWTMGDYHLIAASLGAWVGIGVTSAVAVLGPSGRQA